MSKIWAGVMHIALITFGSYFLLNAGTRTRQSLYDAPDSIFGAIIMTYAIEALYFVAGYGMCMIVIFMGIRERRAKREESTCTK